MSYLDQSNDRIWRCINKLADIDSEPCSHPQQENQGILIHI